MADNLIGLAIDISADPTRAQQAVESFRDKVVSSSSESADSIEKFSNRGIAAYEELQREYIRLGQQTAVLRQQLATNRQEAERLNAAIASGGPGSAEAAARVQQLDAEYGKLRTSMQSARLEFSAVSQQSSAMMRENSLARENAESLAAAFGVKIPEAMQHFIAQSAVAQEVLASAFQATVVLAFASAIWEAVKGAAELIDKMEGISDVTDDAIKKAAQFNAEIGAFGDPNSLKALAAQFSIVQNEINKTEEKVKEMRTITHLNQVGSILWTPDQLKAAEADLDRLKKRSEDLQEAIAKAQVKGKEDAERAAKEAAKAAQEAAKESAEAAQKEAEIYEKARQAIAGARAELPPFIVEIDKLNASIAHENSGLQNSVDILKSYQQIAKEMSATPAQLGFQLPDAQAAGAINAQIQQVTQLTEAERDLLPTERELALANQELEREYPNLTNAERAEWAQIMLTSGAYRQHIDQASKVKNSNQQLASSFRALSEQARTAFSQMAGELTGWGGVATRVFDQVFNAITQQIEIERKQAAEHQISQFSMLQATIDGFKQLAPVKAIIDTAKGIEALASFDFSAAAQWFAAAALWGTVGAFQIASMAGAFQPSGGGGGGSVAAAANSGSGGSAGSKAPPPLASGTASANAAAQNQQHTVQVIFQGPVYGGKSGMRELVTHISNAVEYERMQLKASHTIGGRAL